MDNGYRIANVGAAPGEPLSALALSDGKIGGANKDGHSRNESPFKVHLRSFNRKTVIVRDTRSVQLCGRGTAHFTFWPHSFNIKFQACSWTA